jgi:hypothetical protein
MNPRDYLQCDSCFKNLDDFMALQEGASEEAIKLLEEYTLFVEVRRLKEAQSKIAASSLINSTVISKPESSWNGATIQC